MKQPQSNQKGRRHAASHKNSRIQSSDEEPLDYLAHLINEISDAIISTDLNLETFDLIIRSWNPAAVRIYGWTEREAIGQPLRELVRSESTSEHFAEMQRTLASQKSWHGVLHHHHRDGRLLIVESSASVILDEARQPAGMVFVNRDITEVALTTDQLRSTSKQLQAIVEASPVAIYLVSPDAYVQSWNPAAERIFGWQAHEVIGKKLPTIGPDQQDELDTLRARVLAGEPNLNFETFRRHRDGHLMAVSLGITPLRDANGDVTSVLVTAVDMTERHATETALRASEDRFRNLVESIDDLVFTLDHSCQITGVFGHWIDKADQTAERVLSSLAGELEQGSASSLHHAAITRALAGERVVYEWQPHLLEEPTILQLALSPMYDSDGQVTGVVAIGRDITGLKEAEAGLRLKTVALESAANAFVITDHQGIIQWVNQAFTTLTGYQASEAIGKSFGLIRSGLQDADFYTDLWKTIKAGNVWHGELINRRKDGTLYTEEQTITPVVDDLGYVTHFIAFKQDISQRKRVEAALAEERAHLSQKVAERTAALEQALRVKDEFLASMSHELRTPLSAILSLTESLSLHLAGELNERQAKYVNIIYESGQHLLALINDVLDLAKIESGKMELDPTWVDVTAVCEASLRMVREQAMKKNQHVGLSLDDAVTTLWADERRLKQMLVNLLGNAVKFTPEGGEIGLEVHIDRANKEMHFVVWDTGIGIAPEQLPRLFQPFVQLDSRLAREYEGTGLGLVLVERMASLHRGSVHVVSEPGAGSRFAVVLPHITQLAPPRESVEAPDGAQVEKMPGKRPSPRFDLPDHQILLVEDNAQVAAILFDFLTGKGYNIDIAQDGRAAVEYAVSREPDIILMDIQMPEMDGLEAARRIRSKPNLGDTPIIAMTALAMPGDRERCLEAGMTDYITKPVNLGKLADLLAQYLRRGARAAR